MFFIANAGNYLISSHWWYSRNAKLSDSQTRGVKAHAGKLFTSMQRASHPMGARFFGVWLNPLATWNQEKNKHD